MEKRIGRKKLSISDNAWYYILILPFLLLFFLFTILPMLSSVVLSLFDYDAVSAPIFVGFKNYIRMATGDKTFITVLGNTLTFAVVTGPISFILAFLLAWMINEFKPLVRSILAFLFYAPALVGNAYFIWQILFSGDSYG